MVAIDGVKYLYRAPAVGNIQLYYTVPPQHNDMMDKLELPVVISQLHGAVEDICTGTKGNIQDDLG